MSENATRKIASPGKASPEAEFLARHRAVLVILSGGPAGVEHALDRKEMVLGRGSDADLCIDDDSLSRAHVAFELTARGFRLRDLDSTNGVSLNGSPVKKAELKHGDRIEAGEHVFQYIVEERDSGPRTYLLPES